MSKYFSYILEILGLIVVFLYKKTIGKFYSIEERIIHELTRYFIVGVLISLGSAACVIVIVELFKLTSPVVANTICFFLWAPVSYVGHKEFTFEYSGTIATSAFKFFFTFGAKLIASILTIVVVQYLGYHYLFGVAANWIVIPAVNFIVLKLWVFKGLEE